MLNNMQKITDGKDRLRAQILISRIQKADDFKSDDEELELINILTKYKLTYGWTKTFFNPKIEVKQL